ncbi:MAG: DUF1015 domain-containing protein [Candidatus Omnitrophota bacterium]
MSNIKAFQGYYYNQEKIGNLSDVVAPPYDVITPSQRDGFYEKSPFNVIRLILGKEEPQDNDISNKYSRADKCLKNWIAEAVLKKDDQPALYLLEQEFYYNNKKYLRTGFFSLVELVEFGKGEIYPHEETLNAPKVDRMKLLEAAQANFSSVFSFYIDPKKTVENIFDKVRQQPPFLQARGTDNVENRLWKLTDRDQISKIAHLIKNTPVFIADGHHRYETALNYKKKHAGETKNENADFTLMYFSNTEQDGMLILPTYRAIKKCEVKNTAEFKAKTEKYFDSREINNLEELLNVIDSESKEKKFGLFLEDKFYLLTLKDKKEDAEILKLFSDETKSVAYKELDVRILDEFLIKKILGVKIEEGVDFIKDAVDAVDAVKKGSARMALFLKATRISQIKEVALAGERMPKKSTYFYPKLLSGIIINKL